MNPILSISDYTSLREQIKNLPPRLRTREIIPLEEELNKATIVQDENLDPDIVRINSFVDIEETFSGKKYRINIVLPANADIRKNRISVLAPMGIALIGFREGSLILWNMPSGAKHLRIVKVTNEVIKSRTKNRA